MFVRKMCLNQHAREKGEEGVDELVGNVMNEGTYKYDVVKQQRSAIIHV
jgi:hypothetical protein